MTVQSRAVGDGGPLAGLRVLELGSTVAGPFCGRLLADFGAEVIKVEPPEGDAVRSMGKRAQGRSLYAMSIFRNKKLVAINLRTDEGRDLIRQMVPKVDCIVENFRPGTLEKWGLGYDVLEQINPGLVLVRISGFGQTGPYNRRPGYGVTSEAVSGLRELTGDPDRPPARVSVSLTDCLSGIYGAFGATMALLVRERTGHGQVVDAALYESAFSLLEPYIPAFKAIGHVPTRTGSRLPNHTPNTLYPTRDCRHIHITAGAQTVFQRLAKLMGREDLLGHPHFATAVSRSEHEDEVDEVVAAWTRQHDLADLERILDETDIPAARIYTVPDIFADPHYAAREMLLELDEPVLGTVTVPGVVPKLSGTPGRVVRAGGDVGRDTDEVLGGLLGLDDRTLSRLAGAGVIAGTGALGGADAARHMPAEVGA